MWKLILTGVILFFAGAYIVLLYIGACAKELTPEFLIKQRVKKSDKLFFPFASVIGIAVAIIFGPVWVIALTTGIFFCLLLFMAFTL